MDDVGKKPSYRSESGDFVPEKAAYPVDLFARAAHAIRTDFWFRDEDIDAVRRGAAILKTMEQMGMTRETAGQRFDDLEKSTEPSARARISSERQFLRFALRALAERDVTP